MYAPGATLDPACAPTDSNCGVQSNTAVGTLGQVPYYAAAGNLLAATSTFQILANGTASTTSLVVSNSFTLANLSGFLKATAGAIATSLINLASDVTGILPVANGGTGVSAIQSGFIPFGNGTGAVATSSAFFFDSVNGRLGIGTTNPLTRLSMAGSFSLQSGAIGVGTTSTAYGDSITCGSGASVTANAYANLIGTAKGWSITNDCISGHELADFFGNIYGTTITKDSNSFALLGYNDMRHQGSVAAALQSFQREIYSALIWLSIPKSKIITGQSASVAYTGTWANASAFGGSLGRNSSTNGSTATFTIYGKTLYIDLIQYQTYTRGITITVDGTSYGTYEGSAFTPTNAATVYAPYLIRIPNLTPTTHTVVLTVANGVGSAYFNWAASPDGSSQEQLPSLYVGNTLRMNTAGYAAGGGSWTSGSDDAVRQYNQIIAAAVRDLSEDGLNVAYIDADAHYNLSTDVSTDNVHPNDSGHSHITDAFLAAMNSVSPARGKGLSNINWRNTAENFYTSGTGYFGGNVGIGTTTPSSLYKLDVYSSSNGAAIFGGAAGPGAVGIGGYLSAAYIQGFTNDSGLTNQNLSLQPLGGNVGIGTSNPGAKLDIASSTLSGTSDTLQRWTWGSDRVNWGLKLNQRYVTSPAAINYDFVIRNGTTADVNVLTMLSNGNVGIGTTSPFAPLSVHANNGSTNTTLFAIASSTASATTTLFSVANTGDVTIKGSGGGTCTIGNGSGATSCTSDERLKTNIALIIDPLKSIEQLRGVTFNWKDPTKNQQQFIGVIAQDVQKVFPQAVVTNADGYLAVDYAVLVAPLIEAVKELAGKVNSLAATVAGFAQEITTHHLKSDDLCLKKSDGSEVCVTGDQLHTFLQMTNQQSNFSNTNTNSNPITITDVPPTDTSVTATTTDSTATTTSDTQATTTSDTASTTPAE